MKKVNLSLVVAAFLVSVKSLLGSGFGDGFFDRRESDRREFGGGASTALAASSGIVTTADEALLLLKMGRTGPLCEVDYCRELAILYDTDSLPTSLLGKVLKENKDKGLLTESFIAKAQKIFGNRPSDKRNTKILRALFRAEAKDALTESAVKELMISPFNEEKFEEQIKAYYAKKPESGSGAGVAARH